MSLAQNLSWIPGFGDSFASILSASGKIGPPVAVPFGIKKKSERIK
jgi:hypothetical protein